jgi:DnaJ-class molecular chaperone
MSKRLDEFIRLGREFQRALRGDPESLKVLGLSTSATPDEIRAAFRKLAKIHHPDAGGTEDEFRRIETAYRAALASV